MIESDKQIDQNSRAESSHEISEKESSSTHTNEATERLLRMKILLPRRNTMKVLDDKKSSMKIRPARKINTGGILVNVERLESSFSLSDSEEQKES